jgi:hypothetical protein
MFAQVLKLQGVGKCRERLPLLNDLHDFFTFQLSQHLTGLRLMTKSVYVLSRISASVIAAIISREAIPV